MESPYHGDIVEHSIKNVCYPDNFDELLRENMLYRYLPVHPSIPEHDRVNQMYNIIFNIKKDGSMSYSHGYNTSLNGQELFDEIVRLNETDWHPVIALPMWVEFEGHEYSHAELLIFDTINGYVEYFEPYGDAFTHSDQILKILREDIFQGIDDRILYEGTKVQYDEYLEQACVEISLVYALKRSEFIKAYPDNVEIRYGYPNSYQTYLHVIHHIKDRFIEELYRQSVSHGGSGLYAYAHNKQKYLALKEM